MISNELEFKTQLCQNLPITEWQFVWLKLLIQAVERKIFCNWEGFADDENAAALQELIKAEVPEDYYAEEDYLNDLFAIGKGGHLKYSSLLGVKVVKEEGYYYLESDSDGHVDLDGLGYVLSCFIGRFNKVPLVVDFSRQVSGDIKGPYWGGSILCAEGEYGLFFSGYLAEMYSEVLDKSARRSRYLASVARYSQANEFDLILAAFFRLWNRLFGDPNTEQ